MGESVLINRRTFIKTGASTLALAALGTSPLRLLASTETIKLTILHTNDWHSRIEPFPADAGNNANLGGAAVRAALIKKIRQQEKNVLLLDAGDIFQGTPYFNFFEGELEYKLMSEMGYDAATLGNHDFDNGIEGIVNQLRHAEFSFVNCNYQFKDTLLEGKIKPYRVIKKQGLKIGILGVGIELQGLVPAELYGNIKYGDPIEAVNKTAALLKQEEKCDYVVCLSHLGYKYNSNKISDIRLASQTKDIDLIIGGHTHTLLHAPEIQKNAENKTVVINQVGWGGTHLGRIDLIFTPGKKQALQTNAALLPLQNNKS
jgi:5'-nucleotidase